MPSEPVTVTILVGGYGSRMGGVDKASLELDGKPLLDRVLAAVSPYAAEIFVVANDDRLVGDRASPSSTIRSRTPASSGSARRPGRRDLPLAAPARLRHAVRQPERRRLPARPRRDPRRRHAVRPELPPGDARRLPGRTLPRGGPQPPGRRGRRPTDDLVPGRRRTRSASPRTRSARSTPRSARSSTSTPRTTSKRPATSSPARGRPPHPFAGSAG